MKKIIIVNNNMKVGGVQKSLYNLLWNIEGKYDITLCLFCKRGEYVDRLPHSIKIVEVCGPFRYLGMSQREWRGADFLKRAVLAVMSRIFGRAKVLATLKCRQPELEETYDCAISYLHNGRAKSFYGGVQDFVLHCVKAERKIAFLHGDYRNCGANNPENNRQIEQFDVIAACSDGCRRALVSVLPRLENKCVTVRNFHCFDEIYAMAAEDTVIYNNVGFIHLLMVSRLSGEKGIDRAIRAVAHVNAQGVKACLHLVGDGGERERLCLLAEKLGVSDLVIFHGEQSNPYRYMKNADLLLMTSYHEAAPMVIDEARALGLPILSTETTSAHDMVTERQCGWVCENTQEAIDEVLQSVVTELISVRRKSSGAQQTKENNNLALSQWETVLGLEIDAT